MNVVDQKKQVRKSMRAMMRDFSVDHRRSCGEAISTHISSWLKERLPQTRSVALCASLPDEICTHPLDLALSAMGMKRFAIVANQEDELGLLEMGPSAAIAKFAWNYGEHANAKYPSDENLDSSAVDVIFIPGLAFDKAGHRLGRGLAYFDRLLGPLENKASRPLLVGIAFDEQVVDELPHEAHDVPMDFICTPRGGLRQFD